MKALVSYFSTVSVSSRNHTRCPAGNHSLMSGGIKNGYDVIKYALFGADQFSFGQGLMVSVGCIVCKSCHIPNCPTGITGRWNR